MIARGDPQETGQLAINPRLDTFWSYIGIVMKLVNSCAEKKGSPEAGTCQFITLIIGRMKPDSYHVEVL